MAKFFYIFSMVIFFSVITADALQCYSCRNCTKVDSSSPIKTCEREKRTTTHAPTTMIPTTVAPPIVSTTADPPIISTTAAPPIISSTAAPPIISSTAAPPIISSTDSPSIISSTDAPPIISSTDTPPIISSTAAPPIISSTAAPPIISSTAAPPIISSTAAPPIISSTDAPPIISSTADPATFSSIEQHEELYRGKRSLLQFREDKVTESEPQCIEAVYEENGMTNFIRDCYYAPEENDDAESTEGCRDVVGASGDIVKCYLCTKDLCNASGKATTSISMILAGLISTFFYFKRVSS